MRLTWKTYRLHSIPRNVFIGLFLFFLLFFLIINQGLKHAACEHDVEERIRENAALLQELNICRETAKHGKTTLVLPTIFVITPTYTRPVQKPELTRLCHTFSLVPFLHWIVVEDREDSSSLVQRLLHNCGLPHTLLSKRTPPDMQLAAKDPRWKKPRGVEQRNAGIAWLRRNMKKTQAGGVVYFADDDNTYDLKLFREMRFTKTVSVWPVGLVGGLMVERPQLDSLGKVVGWRTMWDPKRPYALDMAGFAVNLDLLLSYPESEFSGDVPIGYVESSLLSRLPIQLKDLEPKADNCTKVYVWHTRTQNPDLRQEDKLRLKGRNSDQGIEV